MTFVKKKRETEKTASRFLGVTSRRDHDLTPDL